MSPIPPNKEINPNNNSQKPNSEDSLNPSEVQLNEANTAGVEELVDDEQQQGRTYQPLEQNPTRATAARQGPDHPPSEDDDDDDDDTDSEPDELDPDEHFAMLASSRAFAKKTQKDQENDVKYAHSFDCDVFERKRTLESEEIELDESKSRQISNLMSEFKLPDESIPAWAKLVPEHVWKKNLLECLSAKKLDLFATNEQQSSSSN